ncbi:MAG: gamma-glutamyltransferase, partial [SAR202 cluster bacterium]|nr:gamma-glutamyltransferase [SAR202 cluster bacterium]
MKFGSIATGSKVALITAKDILKEGGNAFDAGIGAVFTSMVSEFALTGAGGGGILMGMKKGHSPIIYDFFVDCPIKKDSKIDFKKICVDFGNTVQDFHIGKGSTAIPGNIEGLLSIHQNKGELPLAIILQPAINMARNGIVLSKYQAYINSLIRPILTHSKTGKKLFIKDNQFLKEGSTFKNSEFANFLEMLIKYGKDFFYIGEGAEVIEKFYLNGGYINKKNLNNYKMYKREPLHINIAGYDIFTNSPPSYGGTLMIFLLNLLKKSKSLNSDIINLVKAMELTSMARNEVCNNPENEMEIYN